MEKKGKWFVFEMLAQEGRQVVQKTEYLIKVRRKENTEKRNNTTDRTLQFCLVPTMPIKQSLHGY